MLGREQGQGTRKEAPHFLEPEKQMQAVRGLGYPGGPPRVSGC